MRLLTTLPILVLSTGVLAHTHSNTPQGRSLGRHSPHARYDPMLSDVERRAVADEEDDDGLLGGLVGTKDDDDKKSSTVSAVSSKTTSSAITTPSSTARTTTPPVSSVTSLLPSSSAVSTSISGNISASINGTSLSSISSSMNSTSSTAPSSTLSSSSVSTSESQAVTTVTTDDQGQTAIVTRYLTATPSSDAAQTSAAADTKSDGGISTGAIIGISVGVGAVVLSLIACAIWRMKRRTGDEDEAIRWPELNRHGDSDVHHALPAKQTGKHGFATSPLERSLSNSSSIFAPSTVAPAYSAPPMALNGSNFGATSSLEDYDYDEKDVPTLPPLPGQPQPGSPGYDHEDDYTNMPPPVQMHQTPGSGGVYGGYDSETEDSLGHAGHAGIGAGSLVMPEPQMGGAHSGYHHGQ